jgi:hypothetical protein
MDRDSSSPGHAFYDRLQILLKDAGFEVFVEDVCKPYYAPRMGAPSLPPGSYFRLHMVGYFEGIDSECGIVWRCLALSVRHRYAKGGAAIRNPVVFDHSRPGHCRNGGRLRT